ncbi:MAG: chloride channel protein, partial [Candidatus Hydrogenedentes bacterium]|nr:chloride channel protein [Candidatus Hydrogenedentota bacterium]
LATSLGIGSGASGGVFAPALFVGAVLGAAYGKIAEAVFPSLGSVSGAYAMVGMAAVFAGAARAPMTAIMILFEMTQDYHMILPLMFATVVSTLLAHRFEPESIYTLKLKRRGIDVRARRDENLMRAILVEEAMTPATELVTMDPATPITHLAFWFQETGQHGFVVLDENKELLGVVALSDLDRALTEGILERTVGDICSTNLLVAYPDETLEDAMHHFGARDVGRMPVVDRRDPKRLLGLLGRSDIIRAYSQILVDAKKRDQRIAKLKLEAATGAELIEVDIAEQDAAAGRTLRELPLPPDCVVVSIHRGRRVVVPRGNTSLLRGDRVLALVAPKDADAFRRTLQTGSPLLSR